MNLLDDDAFPDMDGVSLDRVAPYVIRTEKCKAIDADGKPLFKPWRTQMAPVAWDSRHHLRQLLYEAVTDYVREGYNQAPVWFRQSSRIDQWKQQKHHSGRKN